MVTELVQTQQAQQHEESAPVMSMLKQLLQGKEAIQRENAAILKKIEALEVTMHRNMATPVSPPVNFNQQAIPILFIKTPSHHLVCCNLHPTPPPPMAQHLNIG